MQPNEGDESDPKMPPLEDIPQEREDIQPEPEDIQREINEIQPDDVNIAYNLEPFFKLVPERKWNVEPLGSLITLMLFIATYVASMNFYNIFLAKSMKPPTYVNITLHDFFTFPGAVGDGFLFFSLVTVVLLASLMVAFISSVVMLRKWTWGIAMSIISFVLTISLLASYFMMIQRIIPHAVTIGGGSAKVQGVYVVLLYSMYLILLVGSVSVLGQKLVPTVFVSQKLLFRVFGK